MTYNGIDVTEQEQALLQEARKIDQRNTEDTDSASEDKITSIKQAYEAHGEKIYQITNTVTEDDDTETEFSFLFKRPKTQSYDRYVKTMSSSATKASKAFVNDNIVDEQRAELKEVLENYPAMAINISAKLLSMLGLSDSVSVKKL